MATPENRTIDSFASFQQTTEARSVTPVTGLTAGLSAGNASGVLTQTEAGFNYAIVIQLPFPVIKIDPAMLAKYLFKKITGPKVPKALLKLVADGQKTFQKVVDTAILLVKAIPEITVTIVVKLGPITLVNVTLVAEKVPYDVPLPEFALSLPNLAVGSDFNLSAGSSASTIIKVPIPVPSVSLPRLSISGGQLSANLGLNGQSVAGLNAGLPNANLVNGQVSLLDGVTAPSTTTSGLNLGATINTEALTPTPTPTKIIDTVRLPII